MKSIASFRELVNKGTSDRVVIRAMIDRMNAILLDTHDKFMQKSWMMLIGDAQDLYNPTSKPNVIRKIKKEKVNKDKVLNSYYKAARVKEVKDNLKTLRFSCSIDLFDGPILDLVERELTMQVLKMFWGNQTETAKALGISPRGLRGKMVRWEKKYNKVETNNPL